MGDSLADAKALIADALGLPAEALADDAAMDNLESWDSLAHMRIVLAVEARLGAELPPESILELASLNDVAAALAKGAGAAD